MQSTPWSGGPSQSVQRTPPGVTLCALTPLVLLSRDSLLSDLARNSRPISGVPTPFQLSKGPPDPRLQGLHPFLPFAAPRAPSPPLSAPSPHPPTAWTPSGYHPPAHSCRPPRAPTCAPGPSTILPAYPPHAPRGLGRAGLGVRGAPRRGPKARGKRPGKPGSPRGPIGEAKGLPKAAGEARGLGGGGGGGRGGRAAPGIGPERQRAGLTVSHGSHGVRGGGGGGAS